VKAIIIFLWSSCTGAGTGGKVPIIAYSGSKWNYSTMDSIIPKIFGTKYRIKTPTLRSGYWFAKQRQYSIPVSPTGYQHIQGIPYSNFAWLQVGFLKTNGFRPDIKIMFIFLLQNLLLWLK